MSTDHDAAIAAAEARLAEAQADVDRLRAQLTAEHTAAQAGPRLMTWEDGVAAARRRHPQLQKAAEEAAAASREAARPAEPTENQFGRAVRTPAAAYTERHGVDIASVEGARAEARRRAALRRPTGGAA